ncbi:hypothetical protein ACWEQU_22875 [Streptomyces nodosus]|uniref:hypothetical protein n=1 Tax=Streptomyces nodosus TaxID=40318 RepID=UPI0034521B5C
MSVFRTTARLIATCVATGALVGAAAMPALAQDSHRSSAVRVDHDHDRGLYGGFGRDGGRHHGWNYGHHRHHFGWGHHHGRYGHHGHFFGRR